MKKTKSKRKPKQIIHVTKLPFDKYELYHKAVQSPETDVEFYQKAYFDIMKSKNLTTLREDFCAGGAISAEWVKLNKKYRSCGLDLDPEPLAYGRKTYISKLTADQQSRVALIEKNVLEPGIPKADIVAAVNFSYCIFKKRDLLKKYFANVYDSINSKGLFVIDIFGGSQCADEIEDRTKFKNMTYYWDQQSFDPVTNESLFQIHFRYKNKKYENVFTYDWRLWTIPELRDIMNEVGFSQVIVYWEGTNRKGGGDGVFSPVEKGEACLSWIAYIIGVKN